MLEWLRQNPEYLLLGMLALLGFDWVVMDRWGLRGRVAAESNSRGVEQAWVAAEFDGESPLIVVPSIHPSPRRYKCMGSAVMQTQTWGYFDFDVLTYNRFSANKRADITVFKPGWLVYEGHFDISSSLYRPSPHVDIRLRPGPGSRRPIRQYRENSPESRLTAEDATVTEEFHDAIGVASFPIDHCDGSRIYMAIAAMNHVIKTAQTFEERRLARRACMDAKEARENPALRGILNKAFSPRWPFDCDRLPFVRTPSSLAVEVEAELQERST